jgi:hypothetical protein
MTFVCGAWPACGWDRYANNIVYDRYHPATAIFGIDGIFDVECLLRSVPIGFSADI